MKKLDKNLFIRVDAGDIIGMGHLMRCIALATNLKKHFNVIFIVSEDFPKKLSRNIIDDGYSIIRVTGILEKDHEFQKAQLEDDADQCCEIINSYKESVNWAIIDHYGIDESWENKIQPYVDRIIVIDDLANRKHNCDILIDQNFHQRSTTRYKKLIPKKCKQLLGPKYALLRPEFKNERKKVRIRRQLRRILISFGGSDDINETEKVLKRISILGSRYKFDVVVGKSNPHKSSVKQICEKLPSATFHYDVKNMAHMMRRADLSLGGGGISTWERCCMGLPTIVSILSEDQSKLTKEIAKKKVVINLGRAEKLNGLDYTKAIERMNPKKLENISKKCLRITDGMGLDRVTRKIFQLEYNRKNHCHKSK